MEKKNDTTIPTKESAAAGMMLSCKEAEEFRAYKKQKKVGEIMTALTRSASYVNAKADLVRCVERAIKLRQAAIKLAPSKFLQGRELLLKSRVHIDVIIGGDGETLPKVKILETKEVKKMGAKEITVIPTPSLIANCRYGEIKRELKKIARAARGICFKVWVDKNYPFSTIARMARISAEAGAKYFCIPYFSGCERLCYDLGFGCLLEITNVETLAEFKKMAIAGMGRIVTSNIFEIHTAWMKEVEIEFLSQIASQQFSPAEERVREEKNLSPTIAKEDADGETPKTDVKTEGKGVQALTVSPAPGSERVPISTMKGSDLKFL